jgi:broad specificity phosphatase PhoE
LANRISSDLPRALETAAIISRAVGVPMIQSAEWREVNNGVLAGMKNAEVEAQWPGLYWRALRAFSSASQPLLRP